MATVLWLNPEKEKEKYTCCDIQVPVQFRIHSSENCTIYCRQMLIICLFMFIYAGSLPVQFYFAVGKLFGETYSKVEFYPG